MRAIVERLPRLAAQIIAVVLVLSGMQMPSAAFAAPVTVGAPTISGSTAVGSTLTVSEGTWDPVDTTFTYEWRRDGVAIVGAPSTNTYVTVSADIGTAITVSVTGSAETYDSASAESVDPITPIGDFSISPAITVTGTASVGQELSVDLSGVTPTPTGVTYVWKRDGVAIDGAVSPTYTLTVDDAGFGISATVTVSRTHYNDSTVTTAERAATGSFTSTPVPTISGTARVGSTLTATADGWEPTPTAIGFQWKRDGVAIDGETASTYDLVADDLGALITVTADYSRSGFTSGDATSAATSTVAAGVFSSTGTATITGGNLIDDVLTADPGTWAPAPTSFTHQWTRDGVDIDGATEGTYTLTADDMGSDIYVTVTAVLAGYSETSDVSAVTSIPLMTFTDAPAPVITGTERVGSTLTATTDGWSPTPTTINLQWKRDGVDIDGATGTTYELNGDDWSALITVTATATRAGYTVTDVTSIAVDNIAAGSFAFPGTPSISGDTAIGDVLSAHEGFWTPDATSYVFQWYRDAVAIDGETSGTYTLTVDDMGTELTVSVDPTLNGYESDPVFSAAFPVGLAAFASVGTPTISGLTEVGEILTADNGTWDPVPDSFTHQWARDGVDIDGATDPTYTLTLDDMGTDVSVSVTATLTGYASASSASANTAIPLAQFATTGLPEIVGTPALSEVLTSTYDVFNPMPGDTTLQWLRDGVEIPGATADSYTVVLADSTTDITLAVTASAYGYADTTLVSDPVTVAEALAYSVSPRPSVTGVTQVGRTLSAVIPDWTPAPDSFDYQWLRGSTEISGATSEAYELVGDDAGAFISVRVTPVLSGYIPLVRTSEQTTAVLNGVYSVRPDPTITGELRVGVTLSAVTDGWDPTPSSFNYVWQRNGVAISGATGSTHVLVAADRGTAISVQIIPILTGYSSSSRTSVATELIDEGVFASTTVPTIAGSVGIGQTLTATVVAWSPVATFSYQWKRGGVAIAGATAATYVIVSADAGSPLTVTVTGVANGYATESTTSDPTISVPALSFSGGTSATISGAASVGSTLTVLFGTLTPTPNATAFQWRRDGVNISGATSGTYVPTVEDLWSEISATVTATTPGYATWTSTSIAAAISEGAFGLTAAPTVLGTPRVGRTLTGTIGTWTHTPDTVDSQWYCDGDALDGATDRTFVITSDELGCTLAFGVLLSRPGFGDAEALSAATTEVRLAAFNAQPTPTITGTVKVASTLTAVTGAWSPTPTSYVYQWTRDGAAITSATNSTYLLTSADAGALIRVSVNALRDNFEGDPKTSAATSAVASGTFTSMPVPVVSGTAKVDETLSATTATWTPAADSTSYQWKRAGVSISGATSSTYIVTAADLGQRLTVSATGVKAGYAPAVSTSVTTAVVVAATFSALPTPVISGTTLVGETLVATAGTWLPTPDSLGYQWRRDGSAIALATSSSYVLQPADAGKEISVTVTAVRTAYTTTTRTSLVTADITALSFDDTVTPTIDGVEIVGNTLRASTGEWTPTPTRFDYQWLRDGDPITGGTSATYTLVGEDAESEISVTVTGIKLGYDETANTSDVTGVIEPGSMTATPTPVIAGTARVGVELTVTTGSWLPAPVDLGYQWIRDGEDIDEATEETYQLGADDLGATVSVRIEATKLGYITETVESVATATVVEGILSTTPVPTVRGTLQVGRTLTARSGEWAPDETELGYQWMRGSTEIAGATDETYVVTAADLGAALSVRVTGSLEAYASVTKTSRRTAPVIIGVFSAAPKPSVSGAVTVGKTVSAVTGAWSPSPSFTYQWFRGKGAIVGATTATYVLTLADLGKAVRVKVIGALSGYTSVTSASVARTVTAGVFDTAPTPTITGTTTVNSVLTAVPGVWAPVATLSYQWNRNGTKIAGATAATYSILGVDAGNSLSVTVSAARPGFTTVQKTSTATATISTIAFDTAPTPTITGSARVGEVLTAVPGTWVPVATTTTYQWFRDDVIIAGATSATYRAVAADLGTALTVSVTGSNLGYNTTVNTSTATTDVVIGVFSPTPTPVISGTERVGLVLTATPGNWGPITPTLTYQWQRDDVDIAGATTSTYELTALDLDAVLHVSVTATSAGFTSVTTTSLDTGVIAIGQFAPAPTPTIAGNAVVGATVTAQAGTWGPGSVTLAYQWTLGGVAIGGEGTSTYTIQDADLADSLAVTVTATRTAFTTVTKTSAASVVGAGVFTNTVAPTVTGFHVVGATLTATAGTWTPVATTVSYQWLRSGVAISGATSSTYVLVSADKGKRVHVRVTVARANYVTTSQTTNRRLIG